MRAQPLATPLQRGENDTLCSANEWVSRTTLWEGPLASSEIAWTTSISFMLCRFRMSAATGRAMTRGQLANCLLVRLHAPRHQ
jgi:hypothetical protein